MSSNDEKQRWLYSAGIMPLLQRLTLDRSLGFTQVLTCLRQSAPMWGAWYTAYGGAVARNDVMLQSHASTCLVKKHKV